MIGLLPYRCLGCDARCYRFQRDPDDVGRRYGRGAILLAKSQSRLRT
jgi:hypothetical protein